MKAIKVTIVLVIVVVLAGIGIAQAAYNNSHRTGYIYTRVGREDYGRYVGNDIWKWNGEKETWSFDGLKKLADECQVGLTGVIDDLPNGFAFKLSDDEVLVVPGLTFDDQVVSHFQLSVF